MDERSIEPLHVVALWEGEQHLIGQNGDGEKEHRAHCDRQGERTQPQRNFVDGGIFNIICDILCSLLEVGKYEVGHHVEACKQEYTDYGLPDTVVEKLLSNRYVFRFHSTKT